MTPLELTEDDLEVAEASVRFALENCPVEGVLSSEDGTPVSLDGLQTLLERLKDIESRPTPASKLNGGDLIQLRSVIDYTSENCPVEGVSTFHDGRPISGKDIMTLAERLKEH
ncbi:MAG: hypothetical protein ACLQEQ_08430 [Nitrososphaerales archaeon]